MLQYISVRDRDKTPTLAALHYYKYYTGVAFIVRSVWICRSLSPPGNDGCDECIESKSFNSIVSSHNCCESEIPESPSNRRRSSFKSNPTVRGFDIENRPAIVALLLLIVLRDGFRA
jgi:hypothetical protein